MDERSLETAVELTIKLTNQEVQLTMKFRGGHLMFWGCMTAQGIGYRCWIDGQIDAVVYTGILNIYLLPTMKYYKLNKCMTIFQ